MNGQQPDRYENEEGQRFYPIDELGGRHLLSVTTVTGNINKPRLVAWSANMAVEFIQSEILDQLEKGKITIADLRSADVKALVQDAREYHKQIKDEAADRGTRVHKFVEDFVAIHLSGAVNNPFDPDVIELEAGRDIQEQVGRFIDWWVSHEVVPKYQEKKVWSKDGGGFAGTMDSYWRIDGMWNVVDIKTSKGIWPEQEMQLAAYVHAFRERFPKEPVDGAGFLHISELTGFAEFLPRTLAFIDQEYEKFTWLAGYANACENIKAARAADKIRTPEDPWAMV